VDKDLRAVGSNIESSAKYNDIFNYFFVILFNQNFKNARLQCTFPIEFDL